MKYSRFELLALVLGSLAIVASIFIAPAATPQSAEVAAQLLLIVVLAAALHWGRNGGFLAALVAICLYMAMRYPLLQSQGLSSDLLTMLGTRAGAYALVGIVGGEAASRVKYVFARMESDALVDAITGVYSARYAADSILSGVGQWDRYSTEYSLVRIVLDDGTYADLRPSRYRQVMRQVASHVRSDIRMVDDLAFASPATFLVLLPKTTDAGASVVAARLEKGVVGLLGAQPEALAMTVLSAGRDTAELLELARSLQPRTDEKNGRPEPTPGLVERRGIVSEVAQEPSE